MKKHSRNQQEHTQVMDESDNKGKKLAIKVAQANQMEDSRQTLGFDDDVE